MERGRPRAFDKQAALDAALAVFWKNGYQGASLSDLTSAMGINKPSLYTAFGDKEKLYLQALARYGEVQAARHGAALAAGAGSREALAGFLGSVADMLTEPTLPGGCLVVNCATDRGSRGMPAAVAEALAGAVRESVALLEARLRLDREAGRLAPDRDPATLARFYTTVMTGMGVMARAGASRAELETVVREALAVLKDI